jgi:serine O-acetyltransferase
MNDLYDNINSIAEAILKDYEDDRVINKKDVFNQPDKTVIINVMAELQNIILPGYFKNKTYRVYTVRNHLSMLLEDVIFNLKKQIAIVLKYKDEFADKSIEVLNDEAERITLEFMSKIPEIRAYTETDLQAAYDGDPAAYNKDEIIFSYPGFYAITVNRIAHELYKLSVPIIPRVMTEQAHSLTGIDIHPGATIGKYFFIDHGTGVVVGETTVIGDNVKVYQGVTLGALSTRGGQKLKNVRRHPTIEDNVTIYSGSSILGGETVIGKNAVIGSNAFITKSVAEGTRVSIKNQELKFSYADGKEKPAVPAQDEAWYYTI